MPRRTPIWLKRKVGNMKFNYHKEPKETTTVASRERAATRSVKKDIRTDEAKGYNYARRWGNQQKRDGDQPRDGE